MAVLSITKSTCPHLHSGFQECSPDGISADAQLPTDHCQGLPRLVGQTGLQQAFTLDQAIPSIYSPPFQGFRKSLAILPKGLAQFFERRSRLVGLRQFFDLVWTESPMHLPGSSQSGRSGH